MRNVVFEVDYYLRLLSDTNVVDLFISIQYTEIPKRVIDQIR